jgi:hypothetical protein
VETKSRHSWPIGDVRASDGRCRRFGKTLEVDPLKKYELKLVDDLILLVNSR